jgi:Virulence factor
MQRILVFWRDIPSQVIIKRGRIRGKAALPQRFQEAIDRAAMTADRGSSEAYIADWRRETTALSAQGDPGELAAQEALALEAQYDDERLKVLVKNRGLEAQ